MTKILKLYLT